MSLKQARVSERGKNIVVIFTNPTGKNNHPFHPEQKISWPKINLEVAEGYRWYCFSFSFFFVERMVLERLRQRSDNLCTYSFTVNHGGKFRISWRRLSTKRSPQFVKYLRYRRTQRKWILTWKEFLEKKKSPLDIVNRMKRVDVTAESLTAGIREKTRKRALKVKLILNYSCFINLDWLKIPLDGVKIDSLFLY